MNFTKEDLEKAYRQGWNDSCKHSSNSSTVMIPTFADYWDSIKPLQHGWYWCMIIDPNAFLNGKYPNIPIVLRLDVNKTWRYGDEQLSCAYVKVLDRNPIQRNVK